MKRSKNAILIFIILAISLSFQYYSFGINCTKPDCSDDPGNPCNQFIEWDPVDPQPDSYKIGRAEENGIPEICMTVNGDVTSADLTATACLDDKNRMEISVIACTGDLCSKNWSNTVTFWATSCLKTTDYDQCLNHDKDGNCLGGYATQCEYSCCDGSALYLQERYNACP